MEKCDHQKITISDTGRGTCLFCNKVFETNISCLHKRIQVSIYLLENAKCLQCDKHIDLCIEITNELLRMDGWEDDDVYKESPNQQDMSEGIPLSGFCKGEWFVFFNYDEEWKIGKKKRF